MKSVRSNRFLPLLAMLALPLASTTTHAALFWDGGTVAITTDGDGISNGGAGIWDTTLTNWDNGVGPHVAWTQGGGAVFAGTAGIVTLGTNITASTVSIGTTVYNIATPAGTALTLTTGLTNTVGLSSITGVGGVVFTGPQTFDITGGFSFAAPVSGSDTLTKKGPGMVGLGNATNTITGKIVVNSGRFGFGSDRALGLVPAEFIPDAITLNGGILVNGIPNNVDGRRFNNSGVVTLHANRGITIGESGGTFQAGYGVDGRVTVAGVVSGPGKLTKIDGGSFALIAPNTYSGGTDIQVGALSVGDATANSGVAGTSSSLGTGPVNVALGGQLVLASNGLDIPNDVTLNGASTAQARAGSLVGPLNGSNANSKLSGKLTLAGAGANTVSTWWSDKFLDLAGQVTGAGALHIVNIATTAANNRGGIITLSNPLNDYQGDTVVTNNGIGTAPQLPVLRLGGNEVIPDGAGKGNVTINGNLELMGFTDTVNAFSGTGRLATGVGKLYVGNTDATSTYSGTLGSELGGGVVKIGTGTFTLEGIADNTKGHARVEAGKLILAKVSSANVHSVASDGTPENYALEVAGGIAQLAGTGGDQIFQKSLVKITGGTFDLNGTNEGFDSLFGDAGAVTNTAAATTSTLTIGENASFGSPVFSGVIQDGSGAVALTKVGNGIQTLGGANTYTGSTIITAGTLAIDGSLATGSAVSVGANGALAGAGTVNGPVTASGKITPGRLGEIGTLNLGVTNLSGLLELEVRGAAADRLNVSGNLDVSGAAINLVDLEPVTASKIVLVKYSGNLTGELLPLYLPDGYTLVHDTAAKEIYATNGGVVTETFSSYMDGFTGLSAADKLPDADPDQDGISNLVEYALAGFDPTLANPSVGSLASGTLSFTKRGLAVANGDLTYSIEESTTLNSWTTVTPTTDDSTTISYTLPTGRTGVFARLKITRN